MKRWYVLYTSPNAEYAAHIYLRRKGYDTFLPVVKSPRPRRGHETVPLFPSYLFVHLYMERLVMRDLYETPGVRGIVKFAGNPAVVPDEVINAIRERVEAINLAGGLPNHSFSPGDKVLITEGPLAGIEAIFDGPTGPAKRVRILLHILGALNRAEVPVEYLAPVGSGAEIVQPRKRPRRTRGRGRRIRYKTSPATT